MHSSQPIAPGVASARGTLMIVNAMMLVLLLSGLAYYIVQANFLAAAQYDIQNAQEHLAQLRGEHQSVSAKLASKQRPDRIAEFAQEEGMVTVSDAEYVAIQEPNVAGR
jgi:cell division protein FtsL